MNTYYLIKEAKGCLKGNLSCEGCHMIKSPNCKDRLVGALIDRLELSYEDIKLWGEKGEPCLGCKHLTDVAYDCTNYCKWEWRGDKE